MMARSREVSMEVSAGRHWASVLAVRGLGAIGGNGKDAAKKHRSIWGWGVEEKA